MTFRNVLLAASTLALSVGLMTVEAEAATARARPHAVRHATAAHKPAMRSTAMRGRRGTPVAARRSRDGESSTVDQLNAQSLSAARGGAAPAAAPQ